MCRWSVAMHLKCSAFIPNEIPKSSSKHCLLTFSNILFASVSSTPSPSVFFEWAINTCCTSGWNCTNCIMRKSIMGASHLDVRLTGVLNSHVIESVYSGNSCCVRYVSGNYSVNVAVVGNLTGQQSFPKKISGTFVSNCIKNVKC